MRVLVSTTAGAGHFGPLVPFARACAAAGHEVVVAAAASFADQVAAAGFEHRPFADVPADQLGATFGRVASLPPEEGEKVVLADVFGRLDAQAALPGLMVALDELRPDLVLREPCEFGSLAAARARGVPQVVVAIGVSATMDYFAPFVEESLAELDAICGLRRGTSLAVMRRTPTLTSVPPSLDGPSRPRATEAGPVHRFGVPAPGTEGETLPEGWGDPSHPLVYASFGSVAAGLERFAGVYPAVLAAFAERPVRLLLTTGRGIDPSDLGPIPANARVERWWPQADVMPYAAAVVGHGGFGTTMTALAAGVPQVVLPLFSFDQRLNGEHVAAVGAGLHVAGGVAGTADLPGAVDRLLAEPSYREIARFLAGEMATLPPVGAAVPVLERVAAS